MSVSGIGPIAFGAAGLALGLGIGIFYERADRPDPAPAVSQKTLSERALLDQFHNYYYHKAEQKTWDNTFWLGVKSWKLPLDMWIYQEILFDVKPDVVIECGTYKGGSAYYFATLFDMMKKGRVITIDIAKQPDLPQHPRITYLLGSSTAPEIVKQVKSLVKPGERVLVALDSDHHKDHVLNEMRIYGAMVPTGSYMVVEDTNVNGHPVYKEFGPGPMEAVNAYLGENNNFVIDVEREKFGLTFNPRGYLRRVQ